MFDLIYTFYLNCLLEFLSCSKLINFDSFTFLESDLTLKNHLNHFTIKLSFKSKKIPLEIIENYDITL